MNTDAQNFIKTSDPVTMTLKTDIYGNGVPKYLRDENRFDLAEKQARTPSQSYRYAAQQNALLHTVSRQHLDILSSSAKKVVAGVAMTAALIVGATSFLSPSTATGAIPPSMGGLVTSFVSRIDPAPAATQSDRTEATENLKQAKTDAGEILSEIELSLASGTSDHVKAERWEQAKFAINTATVLDLYLVNQFGAKPDHSVVLLKSHATALEEGAQLALSATLFPKKITRHPGMR